MESFRRPGGNQEEEERCGGDTVPFVRPLVTLLLFMTWPALHRRHLTTRHRPAVQETPAYPRLAALSAPPPTLHATRPSSSPRVKLCGSLRKPVGNIFVYVRQ